MDSNYVKKADELAREFKLSRCSKSYALDEKNGLVQLKEEVKDAERSEDCFFIAAKNGTALVDVLNLLRAKAVYQFLGVEENGQEPSKGKEKKETKSKKGKVSDESKTLTLEQEAGTSIPPVIKSTSGKGEDSKPVEEVQEVPKTIIKIGQGDPKVIIKDVPATTKVKVVAYDRELKPHRLEMAKILNNVHPNWQLDEAVAARAKEVSTKMVGKSFITENGEILIPFIEEVKAFILG